MKRVAIISDGWKRLITYAWIMGIEEEIQKHDELVRVYQFNSFGNWSDDKANNLGEYNIFLLPELNSFDGILLDATNIVDEKVLQKLIDRVKEAGVPTVSLGKRIEGFYYAGIDNMHTISELMEHLYNTHGCRKFIYAGGPADNSDNNEREQAYRDFIAGQGLSIEDNPVWSGKYTYDTGKDYFEKFLASQMELPDAFVCANDNIATGLIVAAQEHGYEVPRDFLVTGFDNIEQSKFFKPHLTTVEQKRERIGAAGMHILFECWNGEKPDAQVLVDNICVYSQSCGCVVEDLVDYPFFIDQFIARNADRYSLEDELADFQMKLSSTSTFQRIFDVTKDYIARQDCRGFALVLDERFLAMEPLEVFEGDGYGYEHLMVAFQMEHGQETKQPSVETLMKQLHEGAEYGHFMFSPIHYQNKTLGFVMLQNGNFLFDNPFYCNMLNFMTQSMIRVYHAEALKRENDKLDFLYKHDQLTKVYNRIAFRDMAPTYISFLHNIGVGCMVAFVDADYFKQINDTYGHDKGDEVLVKIASTLKECSPQNAMVFRQGGDEFLVLFGAKEEQNVIDFIQKVNEVLGQEQISVSIGYVITKPEEQVDLEKYLCDADQKMYEVKKSRR